MLSGVQNLPLVNNYKLPNGINGNIKTIEKMREVAHSRKGHPKVRQLALQILLHYRVKSHHYLDESRAIGDYVQKHIRYVRDPLGIEQLHDPVMIIDQIERGVAQGDCDDMALLITTLLMSIGHKPNYRCVRYRTRSGHFNHIYVVDYDNNMKSARKRIVLDAIIKDKPIGYEVKHKSGKEYAA